MTVKPKWKKDIIPSIITSVITAIIIAILTNIIFLPYYIGIYKEKVDRNEKDISKLSDKISLLENKYSFIEGKLNLNIEYVMKTSSSKNIPIDKTISAISSISNLNQESGEKYLMQNLGFTKQEASMSYKKASSQPSSFIPPIKILPSVKNNQIH